MTCKELDFLPDHGHSLVVHHELIKRDNIFGRNYGEWSNSHMVMETSKISKWIGIWKWEQRVHIFRQHAGLEMLNVNEGYEIEDQEGD